MKPSNFGSYAHRPSSGRTPALTATMGFSGYGTPATPNSVPTTRR